MEHYNGFVKRFQHVSRKFPTLEGTRNLLSVYALFYNFMPKMEGKNRGISPLEKAGWEDPKEMYDFINYPACVSPRHPENSRENGQATLNMRCPAPNLGPAMA